MRKTHFVKLLILVTSISLFSLSAGARPEYLKLFAADPYARPEWRQKCSTCHINPEGGGERNDFGKAFAAAEFKITDDLRKRFPDRFLPPESSQTAPPPVTFVQGADSQAIVEFNGKRFLIDTKSRAITEIAGSSPREAVAEATKPRPSPAPAAQEESKAYQQMDVRLISLPTAKPVAKGSLSTDFTHRFPFGEVTDASGLFGLDSFAAPSFGFTYGITDRLHAGFYRSADVVGAPIELYAGLSLLDEQKGHPLTAMARVGVEGRDNFQRNFIPSFELTLARSITSRAQLYLAPAVSISNRPFGPTDSNLPGETTFALGIGGAVNIRPSVALMAEANMRVNRVGRFGSTRPAFGFGIEKASVSRRHAFGLVFSNGAGTTMSQRSATRASLLGSSAEESFKGLTIGFNLSRRLF
ncbi:MAG: DUF5777 family beta-barrel protein [Blastocatellia bacterium]